MTLQEVLAHPALKGLCVGRCVAHDEWQDDSEGLTRYRELAHAHLDGRGKGFICIRNPRSVLAPRKGQHASRTLMHELAHLIAQSGHTDKWRKVMRELGQPLEAKYRKPLSRSL